MILRLSLLLQSLELLVALPIPQNLLDIGNLGKMFGNIGGDQKSSNGACTALHLVHARGTTEPPGMGSVGMPLAAALAGKSMSFSSYPVNYPAAFTMNTASGARDAENHIAEMHKRCPDTMFAVSGYSQGAMLVHGIKGGDWKDSVCAVALFGDPYNYGGGMFGTLPINNKKAIYNACNAGDPVCGMKTVQGTGATHLGYGTVTTAAATFILSNCGKGNVSNKSRTSSEPPSSTDTDEHQPQESTIFDIGKLDLGNWQKHWQELSQEFEKKGFAGFGTWGE